LGGGPVGEKRGIPGAPQSLKKKKRNPVLEVGYHLGGAAGGDELLTGDRHGCLLFFFSSRRRHTRLVSDWSSDVCSSDLVRVAQFRVARREWGNPVHPVV